MKLEEFEELRKLPAKLRIARIRELQEKHKKLREEEEKKLKQEAEELIAKSIEEVTKEEEEEEKTVKERQKEKKEETLEKIAEEAQTPRERQEQEHQYQIIQQYSKRPMTELYSNIVGVREAKDQRGYNTPQEVERLQRIKGGIEIKVKSGYAPNETSELLMTESQKQIQYMLKPRYA